MIFCKGSVFGLGVKWELIKRWLLEEANISIFFVVPY
jgi:hypothetical protein